MTKELNKKGILVTGMSKKAVVISYGYPNMFFTRNFDYYKWIYSIDRNEEQHIYFDGQQRMIEPSDDIS